MKFICKEIQGASRVVLDISDVKLSGKEKLEPYLAFNCSTYKNVTIALDEPLAIEPIFAPVNWFLAQATDEQKIIVTQYFATVNYTIRECLPKKAIELLPYIEQLGVKFLEMVEQANVVEAFRRYAYNNITLQDTSAFGTRPQDTNELTFKEPEIREVMVMAMLCKLASPVFGELINNLPEELDVESGKRRLPKYKESRCSGFLNAVLGKYFTTPIDSEGRTLLDKLQGYILHIVKGLCSKHQDPAAIFHGLTEYTRTSIIMSAMLVRNYVLCQLEKNESNIIKYTDTLVRTLAQTQDTNAHKAQIRTRKAPGSMSNDESGNMSKMEVDSLVSIGTMDGTTIIEDSIERIIQKYRLNYQITRQEWDSCLQFFSEHPIAPTLLNKFLATVVFGKEIGGGRGIEEISAPYYTQLIAMLQLIAFGTGFVDLGNMLTATATNNVRMQLNREQDLFRRTAPTLPNYRERRMSFAMGDQTEAYQDIKKNAREQQWDEQMEELLDDLATTVYTLNTPDAILEQVPEDGTQPLSDFYHNGEEVEPTTNITEQMCMLMQIFSHESE